MWILVMFDLPTDSKPQRKAATAFRNFLLDEGFERSQFSVYARFVNGKEAFGTRVNRIESHLPDSGDVQILNFTDRQYRDMVHFSDQSRRNTRENPQQLVMFQCDSHRNLLIDTVQTSLNSKACTEIYCSRSKSEVQPQPHGAHTFDVIGL